MGNKNKKDDQTAAREASLSAPAGSRSDTERLDFLLRFLSIEDVGDEDFIPGVIVNSDGLEETIGVSGVLDWKEDLRTIIDRAINHSENH